MQQFPVFHKVCLLYTSISLKYQIVFQKNSFAIFHITFLLFHTQLTELYKNLYANPVSYTHLDVYKRQETLSIHADVKSVEGNTSKENLKNCRVQGKYAGTVEDIHKGTVFVRLELGVNAIAHSCYDSRTVGKKDKVSFVVTHIDEDRNVAVGIITRIIKQNI